MTCTHIRQLLNVRKCVKPFISTYFVGNKKNKNSAFIKGVYKYIQLHAPVSNRILNSFILRPISNPWCFTFALRCLFSLSLEYCQPQLELASHLTQMALRVVPLVKSNAWRPTKVPIQPLLGELQITNVPFWTTTMCSHWKVNTWYSFYCYCYCYCIVCS